MITTTKRAFLSLPSVCLSICLFCLFCSGGRRDVFLPVTVSSCLVLSCKSPFLGRLLDCWPNPLPPPLPFWFFFLSPGLPRVMSIINMSIACVFRGIYITLHIHDWLFDWLIRFFVASLIRKISARDSLANWMNVLVWMDGLRITTLVYSTSSFFFWYLIFDIKKIGLETVTHEAQRKVWSSVLSRRHSTRPCFVLFCPRRYRIIPDRVISLTSVRPDPIRSIHI